MSLASHSERFYVAEATSAELPGIIRKCLDSLGWPNVEEPGRGFTARVAMSLKSWGETVNVSIIGDGSIAITSTCSFPLQLFDWGKNKANVARFIAELRKND